MSATSVRLAKQSTFSLSLSVSLALSLKEWCIVHTYRFMCRYIYIYTHVYICVNTVVKASKCIHMAHYVHLGIVAPYIGFRHTITWELTGALPATGACRALEAP